MMTSNSKKNIVIILPNETLDKVDIKRLIISTLDHFKCSKNLRIYTDKNSLFRIIFNLFENASRYGSKINISVHKNIKNLVINIEDNGPGIDQKLMKQIFKPFYKIDNSRNINKGGSGLGLSIAKDLAKKINAKINCSFAKKLNGSLFSITLKNKE